MNDRIGKLLILEDADKSDKEYSIILREEIRQKGEEAFDNVLFVHPFFNNGGLVKKLLHSREILKETDEFIEVKLEY